MSAFILAALVAAAAGTLAAIWWLARIFNTRYVLRLSLAVENPRVARGEILKFKVGVLPSRDVTVAKIVTKLRCVRSEETEFSETTWMGYRRTTPLDWLLNRSAAAQDVPDEYEGAVDGVDFVFEKGKAREFDAAIQIPGDALHTKMEGELIIRWYLLIEAVLPSPPPAEVREEVFVIHTGQNRTAAEEVAGDASRLFAPRPPEPQASSAQTPSDPIGPLEINDPPAPG